MTGRSIRFRLWSSAAISVIIALGIAGVGLRLLFERHLERQVQYELTVALKQLVSATTFAASGALEVAPVLTDPRFQTPLSGYYWQVRNDATGGLVSSRSLWDETLSLPVDRRKDGSLHVHEVPGPGGALLIAVERTIKDTGGRSFLAVVAEDHGAVAASVSDYVGELAPALVLLAAVLLAAILVQITVGLAPLETLRVAVRDVVAGRAARLGGVVPGEVRPLADEINRLLDAQGRALARARSRATDLAHGLKTPLQVLSGDLRLLRAKGETDVADEIGKTAAAIRHHVERELARARVAPWVSAPTECRVAEVADRVLAVVKRMPPADALAFGIEIPTNLLAPVDEGDLSEILGNLLENAVRFARSSIRVSATSCQDGVQLTVSDDGTGIEDADKETALRRGGRLDTKGGTGLGLAIVSDIVDAYGGSLILKDGAPGLEVSIVLPKP